MASKGSCEDCPLWAAKLDRGRWTRFRRDCAARRSRFRRDCAARRSRFRGKKKRQPSAVALGWRGSFSGGFLCRDRIDFGASCADDLIGSAEDFLRALFRYRFGIKTTATGDPILNIPTTEGGSLKAQGFATKQRHGFRFDLA